MTRTLALSPLNNYLLIKFINNFIEVHNLVIENQKDLIDDIVKKFDKSTIDNRIRDLGEILKEMRETELQKTNKVMINKVVVEAFNKAINELKKAKEQIENPIE